MCGYICKHTGVEEWTQTAQTHKKKWSCCDLVTVAEEDHEWENGICSECGYICKHTGAEKWIQTAQTHKKKCNNCGVVTVVKKTHEWENGIGGMPAWVQSYRRNRDLY